MTSMAVAVDMVTIGMMKGEDAMFEDGEGGDSSSEVAPGSETVTGLEIVAASRATTGMETGTASESITGIGAGSEAVK